MSGHFKTPLVYWEMIKALWFLHLLLLSQMSQWLMARHLFFCNGLDFVACLRADNVAIENVKWQINNLSCFLSQAAARIARIHLFTYLRIAFDNMLVTDTRCAMHNQNIGGEICILPGNTRYFASWILW